MQRAIGFNSLSPANAGSLGAFNGEDLAEEVSPVPVILGLG